MRSIPLRTKEEIFRKYLAGYSITQIANMVDRSVGVISSITTEELNRDNNFFPVRELTKIFHKNNLKISDVISGIHLYNKIKAVGLDIPFFEDFIESTDTESFRLKKDHDKFLADIKRIIQFEEQYQIKIEDIPVNMKETLEQHNDLKAENIKLSNENKKLYSQYNIQKSEIEEYREEKPLFLQYKRDKDRYPKYPEWIVNDALFEEASKKIGTKIDPQILYKKLKHLYLLPNRYISIIKKIMTIDEND